MSPRPGLWSLGPPDCVTGSLSLVTPAPLATTNPLGLRLRLFLFFFKELKDIKRIDRTGKNALEKPRNEVTRIRNE